MYKNIGYSVKIGDKVATIIDLKFYPNHTEEHEAFDAIWAMGNKIRVTANPFCQKYGRTIWTADEFSISRIFENSSETYKVVQQIDDGKIVYYD